MKLIIKTILFFSVITYCAIGNAYQHQKCMQGIEAAMDVSPQLEAAYTKMSGTLMTLLNSGVDADNNTAQHLLSATEMTNTNLSSSLVISTLRQTGNFKKTDSIDKMISLHFQSLFVSVKYAKNQFIKFTGSLKNASLREQSFEISQHLEKVSNQISACEK